MDQLAPDYLTSLATQIGSFSAFLGGFAATYLATLLALGQRTRVTTWAIGFAAVASVCFIVAVAATIRIIAMLHPDAPPGIGGSTMSRAMMGLGFGIGLYSLLISLGISGWLHSRTTGRVTTIACAIGIVAVSVLIK